MNLEIKDKKFSEIYCPLRKIDDYTFEKVSTEYCLKKCAYGTKFAKGIDMFIEGNIVQKDIKIPEGKLMCRVKEQNNLPGDIFDIYKKLL